MIIFVNMARLSLNTNIMNVYYLELIATLVIFAFSSATANADFIYPIETRQSNCKGYDYMRSHGITEMNSLLTYQDDTLILLISNYYDQCGAKLEVKCNVDIEGEIHFIVKDISEVPTDCMCVFDVQCKYNDITPGHYQIFVEDKWGNILMQTSSDIFAGCDILFSYFYKIGKREFVETYLSGFEISV